MADIRQQADPFIANGFMNFAAAFNLGDCREWDFGPEVKREANALLKTLLQLFHESEISAKPASATRVSLNADPAFTDFLYELTAQASDGSFIGRRGRGGRRKR